jgi:imidazolonepropionase-like amidohydrolase
MRRTTIATGVATLLSFAGWCLASDQVPGAEQAAPVALRGGTVHTVSGATLDGATVLLRDGKIAAVGSEVEIPDGAQIVDVTGRHVYPGLIACGTRLGLVEIGAVRATRDGREVGELNPNVSALTSVNPDSELIPVTRANGIALAVTHPDGGLVSGSSALIRLDGWTNEDLAVEDPLGVHVRWPQMHVDGENADELRKARDASIRRIRDLFEDARVYDGDPVDLRLAALVPCLRGERPVFLHANEERQILAALDFAEELELRAVLVGGRDAPRVVERLRELSVPVVYGRIAQLPSRRDDDPDAVFAAPARLQAAGVRFAIAGFETSNARNLPYQAGLAAAHGLDPGEALRAITLYPAQILGVDDRYGSVEVGKSATLIVTDGDPLEVATQVERMWIDGRAVDLSSRHTQLYDKYTERLERHEGR